MKRTPAPARRTPLRRVAMVRRPKIRAGEFPPAVRALLWSRFGGLCAVCWLPLPATGWTGQHRRPRGTGGSHDPVTASVVNGLAVHELPCHRRIESDRTAAEAAGWLVRHPTDPATVPVRLPDGRRVWLEHTGSYRNHPPTGRTAA